MVRSLRAIPAREWRLALEAGGWLVAGALAVRLLPFGWLAPALGAARHESPHDADAHARGLCRDVRWAVAAVGARTPWRSTCLMQAVAAKGMLRRRGLASTLYLGVRDRPDGELEAHAWLRCGSAILTGATQRQGFAVVATFAEPGGRA